MTTRQSLIDKFGGDEEAISEYYREMGKRSRNHPNRAKGTAKTGMAFLVENDPEKASKIAQMGGKKSRRGKAKKVEGI